MNPLISLSIPLILASQSPRRQRLLEQREVSFSVQVSPADEILEADEAPFERARTLAERKATPVAEAHPSALVLAADTIVVHEDAVLGKPDSTEQATRMLRRLSDATHTVYTGLSLHHRASGRRVTTGRATDVTFASLTAREIEAYVATGSPLDKAGAYGIQDHTGALFVDDLHGDYYNVVGLPLRTLYATLQRDFTDFLSPSHAG
ncbi:MAG: nucleoside triphosphate pyrophosphatase [Salinibacter sp.]